MAQNPYDVLGLPRGSSEDAVRKQYALVLGEVRRRLAQGRKIDPRKLGALRTAFKELTDPIDDTGTYARPHAIAPLAPRPGDTIWKQGAPSAPARTRWIDRPVGRGFLIGIVLGLAAIFVAWIVFLRD